VLEQAIRSAELSAAVENIVSNRLSDVSGTLRLTAMPSVSDTLLTPLITAFQASHPNVRVQVLVTERLVDLIAEGIDATVDGVATSQWYTDLGDGTFQSLIHWGNGGVSPYVQYDNWLDYTTSAAIGTSANGDYGRYNNPAAQTALSTLASTNPADSSALKSAVDGLETLVSTQVPVAPLLYGADWDEYSTANFTGFVTAANPYIDPSPSDPELPYILMQLKAS